MRVMMKVSIPVETGNAAMQNGTLPGTIDKILAELKPEAAYFAEDNGERTGYIFFDMKEASQLPAIAEPWFLAFNAKLTVRPARNSQDLADAGAGIEQAVKGYKAATPNLTRPAAGSHCFWARWYISGHSSSLV